MDSLKLNVGCGIHKKEGYTRIDKEASVQPDYVLNIEKQRLPFEDNSVDEILAENILEHLRNIDFFMEEAWRVLKPNGLLEIIVPHYHHHQAYSDPDHIRYFTEHTFSYWCRKTIGSDGRLVIRGKMDFDIKLIQNLIDQETVERLGGMNNVIEMAMSHNGVFIAIRAKLRAVKPLR
ncbi:methyltransferase domain-containing protein [Patescibacteria group bacterium]|nr:methyltransferase domain-containing protein [Patescibacteria group bacterium]MBU1999481.1 methyltransferase domain-containing protein [Candidatus Omnitrophota bacterium]